MHFWNKLSIAALMRLTILASMNLIMGRVVGSWQTVLHPLFLLSVLTIDLGLYALMVYSGTLNKTLIGMMVGGLAAVFGVIAFAGYGPSAFSYGGPFPGVARQLEALINRVLQALSSSPPPPPFRIPWDWQIVAGYVAADLAGLILIAAGGITARVLQARSPGRDAPAPPPSS
jgi:hypothetical protein